MTVRRKIFIVIALMTGFALVATYILSRVILEPSSNAQERVRALDNIQRIINAVDEELAALDRQANDFATYDGTYRFVRDRNPEFIKSTLSDAKLTADGVDALVVLNEDGRLLFAKTFDAVTRREVPTPASLVSRLVPGSPLVTSPDAPAGRAGILLLPEETYFFASRPVLTSEGGGPARGTFLIARRFDDRTVARLGAITNLSIRHYAPSDPSLPASLRARFDLAPEARPTAVEILGPNRIAGGALFKDVSANAAFVLAVEAPRAFHDQFLGGLRYFLTAFFAYSVLSLLFGQVLLESLVSSRVHRLSAFTQDVETTGNLSARIAMGGRDEVASLATGLNTMLEALEREVNNLKAAEEAVKRSETKYRALFEASADAIFLETRDGKILDCNRTACEMFGYPKDDLLDLTVEDLVPDDIRADLPTRVAKVLNQGRLFFESFHKRKSGEVFPCDVSMLPTNIGRASLLVVFVRDTTERKRAADKIMASLREKEVLLREIHHRVKNNMQIISSLFNLQSDEIKDPVALIRLKECQLRIRSMSLVHEKLYQSKDLAHVNFADYVRSLAYYLAHVWRVNEDRIKFDVQIDNVVLDVNTAIPCGLIVNELVSNALEHAFPESTVGTIQIALRPFEDGTFELIVQDDGVGLPKDVDVRSAETFGLQLVNLLLQQLDGSIEVARNGGTRWAVLFRELKYKPRF
jgi:PAS domain S-box-containing protein